MAICSGNGIMIVESPSDKWAVQEGTPFVLHNPGKEFDDIFVFLPLGSNDLVKCKVCAFNKICEYAEHYNIPACCENMREDRKDGIFITVNEYEYIKSARENPNWITESLKLFGK